jgi:nucleoid-associated protein YgaU/nucleoid DNA-binding protein
MVARIIDHPFSSGVIPSPYNPDPALLAIVEIIRTGLMRDQHVRLHKFGTFRLRWSKERRIKHPKTGESITVAPAPRITFTPAKQLREWVEPNPKPVIPLKETTNEPLQEPARTESISKQVGTAAQGEILGNEENQSNLQETVEDIIDEQYNPPENLSGFTKTQPDSQADTQITNDSKEPQKSSNKWALGLLAAVPLIIFLLQSDFSNDTSAVKPALQSELKAEMQEQPAPASNNAVINNEIIRTENVAANIQESNTIKEPTDLITARTEPTPKPFYMSPQVHTIQQGENLWNLAKQFYGDALLWPHIYRANVRTLSDPDKIISGKNLVIPGLQESPESLTRKDKELIAEGYFLVYQFKKGKDSDQAIHFLVGAKQYNFEWLRQRKLEIDRRDWQSIN